MENIHQLLNELYAKLRKGIKPGLERTLELAQYLVNPEENIKFIHVAGTNGKGSICSMLASIFMESGYKTGLYTSPHILKFNERIQINGKLISDEEIIDIWKKLESKANEIEATFFEITTIMAFEHFKNNNVDIAIIETGMGGRFDSTNVINPLVSVISSISMDHQDFLGGTISKIASEKAGIIKDNVPIILQKNIIEVNEVIEKTASELTSPLFFSDELSIKNIEFKPDLTMGFEYDNFRINSPFVGHHQIDNHRTVLKAIELTRKHFDKIDSNGIKNGIERAKSNSNLCGRLELISNSPKVILDGSHNPEAIYYCLDTIKKCGIDFKEFELYFTCMIDKDYKEMLSIIRNYSDNINIVEIKEKIAARPEILINVAKTMNFKKIKSVNLDQIKYEFIKKKNNMLIFGSFYLISEFLERLEV